MMRKATIIFLLISVSALQAFSAVGKKEIRIRLREPATAITDEARIFVDLGVRQFVSTEDVQMVFDTTSSAPLVYSFSADMVPCASNSFGTFTPDMIIPLGFKVVGDGIYIFSCPLLDNFDSTTIVRLEDRSNGSFTDLRGGSYSIYINQVTQNDSRFFLHVSYPAQISTADAGCGNDDGAILVSQDNSILWKACSVYDDANHRIYSDSSISGNFTFGTLPSGDYRLIFSYGQYSAGKLVHLDGRNIASAMTASTLNGVVGQDIQFTSNATNTSDYFWEFGDGSEITGVANPAFAYQQPGTYTVTVTCSNIYGCVSTSTVTVTISAATAVGEIGADDASVTVQNRTLRVLLNKPVETGQTIQVLNSVGQLITSNTITQGETTIDLGNAAAGVYIVRIADGQRSFTKKVVLSQ